MFVSFCSHLIDRLVLINFSYGSYGSGGPNIYLYLALKNTINFSYGSYGSGGPNIYLYLALFFIEVNEYEYQLLFKIFFTF